MSKSGRAPKAKGKGKGKGKADKFDPSSHIPSEAALRLCPEGLTLEMKTWWAKPIYISGIMDNVGPRGCQTENAMTWVDDILLEKYLPEVYGEEGLSYDDYQWIASKISRTLYDWLYRAGVRYRKDGKLPTLKAPALPKAKKKVDAHDYWYRSDPAPFNKAREDHEKEHGKLNFGNEKAFKRLVFSRLPQEEREKFEKIAQDDLATMQALEMISDPSVHEKFAKTFVKDLKSALHHAEAKGSIKACVQILIPLGNNQYKISSIVSRGFMAFAKSGPIEDALLAMQDYVEESGTNRVMDGPPRIQILCNFSNNKFALFPPFPSSTRLDTIRALWRCYFTIVWVYYGGTDRVPWGVIALDIEEWIPQECIPEGASWCDPGSMARKPLLDWIRVVHDLQDRKKAFWLRQTIAPAVHISPSESEEARRELIERNGKSECHLFFERPVTHSHATGNLPYTELNFAYGAYLAASKIQSSPKPDHWLELPPVGPESSMPIFHPEEENTIRQIAAKVSVDLDGRVEKILDRLLEHRDNVPAVTSKGIWAFSGAVPTIIPHESASAPVSNPFDPISPPLNFLRPIPNISPEATLPHFLSFIEIVLTTGLLHHSPSNTLIGGSNGPVRIIRSLLVILFCVLAIRGELELPGVIPVDCEKSKLPFRIYERTLEWIDVFIEQLKDSTKILRQTSEERSSKEYAALQSASLFVVAEPAEPDEPTPPVQKESRQAPVPGRAPTTSPQPRKPGRQRTTKSRQGKRKRPLRDESESDEAASSEPEGSGSQTQKSGTRGSKPNVLGDPDTNWSDLDKSDNEGDSRTRPVTPESEDDILTTEDATSGRKPPLVFGELEPLPKFHPIHFESAAQAITALQEFCVRATEHLNKFRALEARKPKLDDDDLKAASSFANSRPVEVQPLYILAHLRKAIWKRNETMAAVSMSFSRLFLVEIRNFMSASAYAEQLAIVESLDISKPVESLLVEVHQSKKIAAQLHFAYRELEAFHIEVSRWFHAVNPAWWTSPPFNDLAEVRAFAKAHVYWVARGADIREDMLGGRLDILEDLGMPRDDPVIDVPIAWFQFGYPSETDEPSGLRESLGRKTKHVPNSTKSSHAITEVAVASVTAVSSANKSLVASGNAQEIGSQPIAGETSADQAATNPASQLALPSRSAPITSTLEQAASFLPPTQLPPSHVPNLTPTPPVVVATPPPSDSIGSSSAIPNTNDSGTAVAAKDTVKPRPKPAPKRPRPSSTEPEPESEPRSRRASTRLQQTEIDEVAPPAKTRSQKAAATSTVKRDRSGKRGNAAKR